MRGVPMAAKATVIVRLGGKPLELVPTLDALITISGAHDGINGSIRKVAAADFLGVVDVIACGLGRTTADEVVALRKEVYEAGLSSVVQPAHDFLQLLARGGRTEAEHKALMDAAGKGEGVGAKN
jgi:hypothetical protein